MQSKSAIEIVQQFWDEVLRSPQSPDAIDALVHEDFVITSGGHAIVTREAFKQWVVDLQKRIKDLEFEVLDIFQSEDGTRVATRWRVTGRNNGFFATEADGAPITMAGNAIIAVGEDGCCATTGSTENGSRDPWRSSNRQQAHCLGAAGSASEQGGNDVSRFS